MIRNSTPEDFDAIMDMSAEFWKMTNFDEPFDKDHTRVMVELCYDHGLQAVVEIDGKVCGFISAVSSFVLGSPKAKVASEIGFWLNPDVRGNMIAPDLIRYLERLCAEQGVKYLSLVFMESSMPEKVKSLYESLGYKLQETVYMKVLI
jgi:GNAT superfamily N-acetyltransferase